MSCINMEVRFKEGTQFDKDKVQRTNKYRSAWTHKKENILMTGVYDFLRNITFRIYTEQST